MRLPLSELLVILAVIIVVFGVMRLRRRWPRGDRRLNGYV